MRIMKMCVVSGITLSMTTAAQAHEVPYGPGGCGAGSMLLGNEAGIMQIVAMTTNGLSGNQTFGITTGTLGCDVGGSSDSAAIFVEANREAVAKDVSRGSGETIVTLAEIGECGDAAMLGSYLQGEFDSIFPNAAVSDHTVGTTIVDLMTANGELSCVALSEES